VSPMDLIEFPIEDVIDLHTFSPKDIPNLLNDYFEACIAKKIYSLRIIHGKGSGILKKRVEKILKAHPDVLSFQAAPAEAGGWGATVVQLRPGKEAG